MAALVEAAEAMETAAAEVAKVAVVDAKAEVWAAREATVDSAVAMAAGEHLVNSVAVATAWETGAKAAVSAARAETAAASAGSATRMAAVAAEAAEAASTLDAARRRSRCSRCPGRRLSTPTQGRHPHRCRCWR